MNPARTVVCCLIICFSLPASGQTNRWSLTFNPLGMLEPNGALGLGVGYAFNPRWELWSETSRIQHLFTGSKSSSGIRQIAQLKYFVTHGRLSDFFLATEIRYKGYQFAETSNFYNSSSQTTQDFSESHHYRWWGTALQLGARQFIGGSNRFYLDVSIGIGYRHVMYDEVTGIPSGYKQVGGRLLDMTLIPIYYPGSVRLVWTFGR